MRIEIMQDVERCMPEEQYFRDASTQRIMLDILFIYCKLNPDVGYRQGMHEVLAPILWVLSEDGIALDGECHVDDVVMFETLDASYIEHDAFTLFALLMQPAKSFYELGEPDAKPDITSTALGQTQMSISPIVDRSKRIHEEYLARLDPELALHLTAIEVLPQIFLMLVNTSR